MSAPQVQMYDGEVCDPHIHLFDLENLSYPWIHNTHPLVGDLSSIRANYKLPDLLKEGKKQQLSKFVHVQAECTSSLGEVEFVEREIKTHGVIGGIVAFADLASDKLEDHLVALCQHPNVRGIRQLLNWDNDNPNFRFASKDFLHDEKWLAGLSLLPKFNLSFDMHVNFHQLPRVHEVATRFSDVFFIINHHGICNHPKDPTVVQKWRESIVALAGLPNVVIKISGFGMFNNNWDVGSIAPFVSHIINSFGAHRCMFASNFTVEKVVSSYDDWYNAFKTICASMNLTYKEQQQLFHDNAVRYYRLLGSNSKYISPSNGVKNFIRFLDVQGSVRYGVPILPGSSSSLLCDGWTIDEAYVIDGDIYNNHKVTNQKVKVAKLLEPIQPTSIICIGLNYRRHATECGLKFPENPVVFFKNISASCAYGDNIVIPKVCFEPEQTDYECELAIVIGKDCKNVSEGQALNYVLGFTAANDVSARTWQLNATLCGGQWNRGKSFDTFCPLGPGLTLTHVINPDNLKISTRLNGNMVQDSSTSDMIFNVKKIVSFLSQGTTLKPGTVIVTGTPEGVGFARKPPLWLHHGDNVQIIIEDIGVLNNNVVNEQ